MSASELRAAAFHRDEYYLVGFIDDGAEQRWSSRILQNPLPHLLEKGMFDVDVELQARANDVFELDKGP
jgi:hypothetical protein